MHSEAFRRRKQESEGSQSSEDKTADETILQERWFEDYCKGLDADLRIIAKQAGLIKCEQLETCSS